MLPQTIDEYDSHVTTALSELDLLANSLGKTLQEERNRDGLLAIGLSWLTIGSLVLTLISLLCVALNDTSSKLTDVSLSVLSMIVSLLIYVVALAQAERKTQQKTKAIIPVHQEILKHYSIYYLEWSSLKANLRNNAPESKAEDFRARFFAEKERLFVKAQTVGWERER